MRCPLILHHNDLDGCVAAWLYHKKLPKAEVKAVGYDEVAPEGAFLTDRPAVVILDFSFTAGQLAEYYAATEGRIAVFDHHKTPRPEISALGFVTIGTSSASMMVFEILRNDPDMVGRLASHPTVMTGMKRLIDYVDQIDLGLESEDAAYACAVLEATVLGTSDIRRRFELLDEIARNFGASVHGTLFMGQQIEKWKSAEVGRILRHGLHWVLFDGLVIPAVNSPSCTKALLDRMQMTYMAPFAIVWWKSGINGCYEVRIRALSDKYDASAVAQKYGGGGHRYSAGFRVTRLPWENCDEEENI